MTKRQAARAKREAFENAPYRVYYGTGVRTFACEDDAVAFALDVDGVAYAGTLAEVSAGVARVVNTLGVSWCR